jgi:hypothetical protein
MAAHVSVVKKVVDVGLPKSDWIETVSCAICKVMKGKDNHWWELTCTHPGGDLTISPVKKLEPTKTYVCGKQHVIEYVNLYLEGSGEAVKD